MSKRPPILITVEKVYHQIHDREPSMIDLAHESTLTSEEEPYSRTYLVTPNSKELDYGWIEECSMVVIQNLGPLVLELPDMNLKVPVDSSTRFYPTDFKSMKAQAKINEEVESTNTRITLTVFPA